MVILFLYSLYTFLSNFTIQRGKIVGLMFQQLGKILGIFKMSFLLFTLTPLQVQPSFVTRILQFSILGFS